MFFNKKKNNCKDVDVGSLNEILDTGKKLIHIIYAVTIVVLILLGTYLLREWKILKYLGELFVVISPIFIGVLIAWLFDPVVTWLQNKKIPRILGCILIYLLLIVILFVIGYSFVPMFAEQISDFIKTIPDIGNELKEFANNIFRLLDKNGIDADMVQNKLFEFINEATVGLTTNLPNTLLNFSKNIFSGGLNIVLGLMVGFYMLFDFNKINDSIINNLPTKWRSDYEELGNRINTSLRNYVQGILLIMFLVFITQSIGLTLAGLKAPLLFALFCALTDIIPYFGPYIGAIPAVIVGFTISPVTGVLVVISILIVQLLENNFYQPLIMGHTMKLHPVTIMVGLLIFQHFFGIIGMVIATPVVACLKVIFTFLNEKFEIKERIVSTGK